MLESLRLMCIYYPEIFSLVVTCHQGLAGSAASPVAVVSKCRPGHSVSRHAVVYILADWFHSEIPGMLYAVYVHLQQVWQWFCSGENCSYTRTNES